MEHAFRIIRNALFGLVAFSVLALAPLQAFTARYALAQTQKVVIDCLPPWQTNQRFAQASQIRHPGLSLNGFDCGDKCAIGYGLKQVLEKVYGSETDKEVQEVFKAIVKHAKEGFQDTTSFGNINNNTSRLQSKGFVALASYVLENNDYDPTTLNPALPAADVAVKGFRKAIIEKKWKIRVSQQDDGIKWATPVTNTARAMDFYLALENAYEHYDIHEYKNPNSKNLLSAREKDNMLDQYIDLMKDLEKLRWQDIFPGKDWIVVKVIDRYKVEPGNAPLKMQVALGYAAFTWQSPKFNSLNFHDLGITREKFKNFISRAFKAAGAPTVKDRHMHWRYQSDSGKYFWAEGAYYFHLTLSQVIPFWHAARIHGMLSKSSFHSYNFMDPFREPWFLNPLHWLADISTPDGKTPPIDDGNKQSMYNTWLLPWTGNYGDETIGKKFAWVVAAIERAKEKEMKEKNMSMTEKDHPSPSSLYPVEIAIPRRAEPTSSPLAEIVGNTFENRSAGENGRQEVVVRRTISDKQHYILLNGESGDAIERGEGHEQGDQMQLLYYVDDVSYLADSGYDDAKGLSNSTWNHYYDHNVMTMKPSKNGLHNNDGGIQAPILPRKLGVPLIQRLNSEHQNVNEIYYKVHGHIDLVSANIGLRASKSRDPGSQTIKLANYYRNILFIRDKDHPYIVDINAISNVDDYTNFYKMYYHVNSKGLREAKLFKPTAFLWSNIYKSKANISAMGLGLNYRFIIQSFPVERSLNYSEEWDTIVESSATRNQIKKLILHGNIQSALMNDAPKKNFTAVSFLRAVTTSQGIKYAKENVPLPKVQNGKRNDRLFQYYTAIHDSSTVDVVVSLSARHYSNPLSYSLHFPVIEADSFYVELPDNMSYGFVRLVKNNKIWDVNPSFQLNLLKSVPQVGVSGPFCIKEGSTGRYTFSHSGGKPPYSHSWSWYRICPDGASAGGARQTSSSGPTCNAWHSHASTKSVDFGGYEGEDFKIRVSLTDSSSPRQSVISSELPVQVLSSTEGSCSAAKLSEDANQAVADETDLLEFAESIPEAYALRQNYPNPFNPSTEVLFDLPEDAMVSLVVYDVLGREVTRLVEEELSAGSHSVRFDAGNLPSGVYLYRMQAGDFQDTGRMLLLK